MDTHQQPPFIGQGMCQGVRDVTNICWKLAAVLRGEATDGLLDTYEQERSRHVRTLTERIKNIGATICIRDPEAAWKRDEAFLKQGGGRAPMVTRQEIVPPLETGLLAPNSGPGAGTIFPQPRLSSPSGTALLDEIAGWGWRVFWDARDGRAQPQIGQNGFQAFALGGEGCLDAEGISTAWFDRFGCRAAIVRPDHYVYCALLDLSLLEDACRVLRWRLTDPRTRAAGGGAP